MLPVITKFFLRGAEYGHNVLLTLGRKQLRPMSHDLRKQYTLFYANETAFQSANRDTPEKWQSVAECEFKSAIHINTYDIYANKGQIILKSVTQTHTKPDFHQWTR